MLRRAEQGGTSAIADADSGGKTAGFYGSNFGKVQKRRKSVTVGSKNSAEHEVP